LRVAYRQAGQVMVCEILYGPNVVKHAVIDAERREGEVVTFSGLPLPIACRPPAGRRRGEQVGVAPEALVDAHGVFAYAGIAAERIALERGHFPSIDQPVTGWQHWEGAARRDRDELARISRLLGLQRPADEFYAEYCEEARRLIEPLWKSVVELAEALLQRNQLMGHQVDRIVHGDAALDRPVITA